VLLSELVVKGYVDSNFTGDHNNRIFTLEYVFTFVGWVVSWLFKFQDVVALSIIKAKYMETT